MTVNGARMPTARGIVVGAALTAALAVPIAGARSGRGGHEVQLWGAGDLTPLGLALQAAVPDGLAVRWSNGPTEGRLEALRRGDADAVLIGYDPAPEQLAELRQTTIASDAVVLLVDENSYEGGRVNLGRPVARSDPFRSLTMSDVKGLVGAEAGEQLWTWSGAYWRWGTQSSGAVARSGQPGRAAKEGWNRETRVIRIAQNLRPGRFDTQTALYQRSGLEEARIAASWSSFSHEELSREEEVIATEYASPSLFAVGQGDFRYHLTFASRPVAVLALKHVPVRVLSVDGVDPVADLGAVRAGRYPLSRRIHLVTRAPGSAAGDRLAAWLVAAEGQAVVERVGFVPASAESSARQGGQR